jgi:DNA-binding Lrp family transcriptional regulator
MVRGLVLIKTTAKAVSLRFPNIVDEAKKISGVTDAFPVFGRFDVVVFIDAKDFEDLKNVALKINAIPGVKSTETLPEA